MRPIFVGEPIVPVPGTADLRAMAAGEPGLPGKFTWRGKIQTVAEVLARWKTTGPCVSGASERYVRKHWFRIRTIDGIKMEIYCDRQPRVPGRPKQRWWLYAIHNSEEEFPAKANR